MKKILAALYFVILFAIMASYIAFGTPDNSLRIHIASADQLSKEQQNQIAVWVRDLDTGSKFRDCHLRARWSHLFFYRLCLDDPKLCLKKNLMNLYDPNLGLYKTPIKINKKEFELLDYAKEANEIPESRVDLPENGETILPVPDFPLSLSSAKQEYFTKLLERKSAGETGASSLNEYGLMILLYCGQTEEPRKTAFLPLDTFTPPEPDTEATADNSTGTIVLAPSTFMVNQPNMVYLRTVIDNQLYEGTIRVEQTYGQPANVAASLETMGLAGLPIALQSPADFKFSTKDTEFYASFVPNEKPFHAEIVYPLVSRDKKKPLLKIQPIGTMPTITVDYFDERAWIGRQTIPAELAAEAELTPAFDFTRSPYSGIIYARVSNSPVASDSSQTFALIVSRDSKTELEQAAFALSKLKDITHDPYDDELFKFVTDNHPSSVFLFRDYALHRLAQYHSASIQMRLKTETTDAMAFETRKSVHKNIANFLLVIWFGVGVIAFTIAIVRSMRKRREDWEILMASDNVDAGQVPQHNSGILLLCLAILFIGLMISLYYMMQII